MTRTIADTISRSSDTILEDALGLAALVVMLFAGLSLPGLF